MDVDWLLDLSVTVPSRCPLIRDITSRYCNFFAYTIQNVQRRVVVYAIVTRNLDNGPKSTFTFTFWLCSGIRTNSGFDLPNDKANFFSILKGITVLVYNLYYYYALLDYTD